MMRSVYLLLIPGFLLFAASCSMQKKGGTRVLQGNNNRGSSSAVLTDASSARGKSYSGKTLKNYADLLNVSTDNLNPNLYTFIDDWMGIPHRLGGQSKSGIDCSGFVNLLYRDVYRANLARTSRDMESAIKKKKVDRLQEGDLVFFSFGGRGIDHVGVYLHNSKFVHVSTRKGVIISDLTDSWYAKTFVDAGELKI